MRYPGAYWVSVVLLLFSMSVFAQQDRRFEGYLKRDVRVFDGTEILRRGEKIACNVEADEQRCCYESHAGTACVNIDDLSKTKVPKRDVAIAAVVVNQSSTADRMACEEGIDFQNMSDAFVWSYGVRLRPGVDGRALIRVGHLARKGPLMHRLPHLTKTWVGPINEKCHNFNFTKDDITAFFNNYEKIWQFLNPPRDLNLDVEVWVEVFSEFDEESYQNNLIKIKTQLPVDSADNWPLGR